ncbi:hypothetical protein [Streptomyces capparidis]
MTAIHTPGHRGTPQEHRAPEGRGPCADGGGPADGADPAEPAAAGPLGALLAAPLLASALLVTLRAASFAGGGTRSWWRRGDNGNGARAARDAAAQAFYELDSAQRELRISVETIEAVDDSPAARGVAERFAAVSRRIDEASHVYISAVDAHDLEAEELDAGTAARATAELRRAQEELRRAQEELDRFAGTLGPLLEKAEAELSRLVPAVERAKRTLLAATEALDAARGAGLRADDLAARLAALAPELTKLNQGAGVHGVRETLRRADELGAKAEAVRAEAERLPQRVREIDRRLVSLRTRVQALQGRAETVDPVLSELRRRYTAACWLDLQGAPERAGEAVARAEERLREAAAARAEQRWPDATALLGTVRALLNQADEALSAVPGRLRVLDEVARDPSAEVERTRFALRDAQRLAMTGRTTPDPRHARPLDAAVARIDRAVAALDAPHPDWWHFLREMAEIREATSRVVAAIREDLAGGR